MNTQAVSTLRTLVAEPDDEILAGDLILLEVLQSARDKGHARRIEQALRAYPVARLLDADPAVRAAYSCCALRSRGITIRRTIDMVIATFCVDARHRLLHDDRDFEPMSTHLGLQTVRF